MSPHSEGPARRVLNWLRGGRPEGIAQGDYIALMGVLHRKLTTAEVEHVATALLEEGYYDDDLITHDEIHDMIAAKVHEEATEEDIARVSELLAKAGIHLEAGLPGADA
ncbi:MAG TPA: DUF3349 domain-containing protein [Propionicimonas sp.]|jgi:uncharacterized protein YcgL (UPF0745 family)|nr:DUF3349 domain-containing protein [Propionicimonas sp.]